MYLIALNLHNRGATWFNTMIAWICNSLFLASDWAIQNNALVTSLTCHKTGHLTTSSGRRSARRVAGRTYFGILLAMIADGSTYFFMLDGDATLNIVGHQ